MRIPKAVASRLTSATRRFQKILSTAKDRDLNESDTVTIVTDMLSEVFGFDKYLEVTSEQAIRGTYCDLAVKFDDSISYLVEVKAVGLSLRENHLRQAVNYGANQGIPWVVLTNGQCWEIHRISFERPIRSELVCAFDFLELNPRLGEDHHKLFLLCKEGLSRAAVEKYHEHVQVVNRFMVGAVIQSDAVLGVVRRELRRLSPGARITLEEVGSLLPEVLKRDVLEGDAAASAKRRVSRAAGKTLRKVPQKKRAAASQEPEGGGE